MAFRGEDDRRFLSEDLVRRLLEDPAEEQWREYKAAIKFTPRENKSAACKLVKHVLALANFGGGYLVIGFSEPAGGLRATGVSEEEARSFEQSTLNRFVNKYADPPISCSIRKPVSDGKTFVVVGVPGFTGMPHLCKRHHDDSDPKARLEEGRLYIRTDDIESAPVTRASDLNAILERGVKNRADLLLRDMDYIIRSGSPAERAALPDHQRFQAQAEEAEQHFHRENPPPTDVGEAHPAYRRITAYPARFDTRRFTLRELRRAIEGAPQRYRSRPLMLLLRGNDEYHAVEDGFEFMGRLELANAVVRREMWQLRSSGLFFLIQGAWEDDDPGGSADYVHASLTVTHIAEGVELMVRIYEALGMGDELVTFATALLGVQGRPLLVTHGESTRGWRTDTRCAIDLVKAEMTWPLPKWRSDLREQSGRLGQEILLGCNWRNLPDYFVRKEIDSFFDTPH